MSKYTMYYKKRQKQYMNLASGWAGATSNMELSERQRRGMTLFFRPIAKRFGLIQEFKDLGVI